MRLFHFVMDQISQRTPDPFGPLRLDGKASGQTLTEIGRI